MSEEYLDLVDENGELTGERELRSVCHAKGLWHQTVHIYLFRKNNGQMELLTHQRSKEKETSPNKWASSFGGHVKNGETINETILSETEEEIGLKIKIEDLIIGFNKKYDGTINREYIYVFYLLFEDNLNKLSFNDGEVQQVKWRSFAEIEKAVKSTHDIWSTKLDNLLLVEKDLLSKIA